MYHKNAEIALAVDRVNTIVGVVELNSLRDQLGSELASLQPVWLMYLTNS